MSAKTISVFSNKGGVGKTFISTNLATALTGKGHRVLVVEFDFQAGQDMARMLNLTPRHSLADVIPILKKTEESSRQTVFEYATKHRCGLSFLPVIRSTKQIESINTADVALFWNRAKEEFDYIIVDAGRSFNELLVTVLDFSNLILLVATPDILAVYQVKWCLDILQSLQFPLKMIKLVLNRSESRGGVAWQEVKSVLPCEILGHIPSDGKAVGLSLNKGIPCVLDNPKSKIAESFVKLAGVMRRQDIYVTSMDMDKPRNGEFLARPGQFWQNFGIEKPLTELDLSVEDSASAQEHSWQVLKKQIHEKLVERLHLEGIKVDGSEDAETFRKVRKMAETVVTNLLLEEAGGQIVAHQQRIRFVKEVVDEALGLGPLEEFLKDEEVTDIMANNRDEIYVEKKGKLVFTGKKFASDSKMRAIIDRIIAPLGRRIDESTPMVDARLPDGSRVNAIIPPLSLCGPMITIRKFGEKRISLEDLLGKHKSLSPDMSLFLQHCVELRQNIIVSGGTGAGKTTFLNILSQFIPDGERIISIEDAAELRLQKSHWARLESRPPNVEGRGEITIRDLFRNSLRMRPDRIIIGECRGAEVLDMLQAMNTGHDGSLTTLHANSTRDALTRLHSLILLSGVELPVRSINEMIGSAIDLMVHVSRFSDGTRKVTGISEVTGITEDFHVDLKDIFSFKQEGIDDEGRVLGRFHPTGYIPQCFEVFRRAGRNLSPEIFIDKEP